MDRIDTQGYRANVGIILTDGQGRVLIAGRVGSGGWQFPQGGIKHHETPERAMYRELKEEVGLEPEHVGVLGFTKGWLRYRLPKRYIRYHQPPVCIGQKQIWFLLRLETAEDNFRLDVAEQPEFDAWRWAYLAEAPKIVAPFKQAIYSQVVDAFSVFAAG